MNLYRLDTASGPLTDLLGPRLIRRYSHAITVASKHCAVHGERVTVTRISGGGALKVVRVIEPNREAWNRAATLATPPDENVTA